MRKSGVLLPIFSLPSEYGIGCFSESAYTFIDKLKSSGQSFWQILPICPTGFGNSPYQSFSTFAGNPYMISLKELIEEGLLSKNECDTLITYKDDFCIDYKKQYENRIPLLYKAYERSDFKSSSEFKSFKEENSLWLDDYTLFMALKNHFGEKEWQLWDESIKKRRPEALQKYRIKLKKETDFYAFLQFKFYSQWKSLREYARKSGISIIGDMPIYVSSDSADVWTNPKLFELDENGLPQNVAGCPPDGFSKAGQKWGNPLYRWENHKSTKYEWWLQRISYAFRLYDVLRIDHFRGFDEYYSISYKSPDAVNGVWRKGPGASLFKELPSEKIIAEDLGFITDSVKSLLKECGFPGMKVLEFAFDSRDTGISCDYLPHNYPHNCIAYTGTHDNQTLISWFNAISPKEQNQVRQYLGDYYTPDEKINIPLISLVMRSAAMLTVIPLQDWMGLTDGARINTPSSIGGNWQWRMKKSDFDDKLQKEMYEMTRLYERL